MFLACAYLFETCLIERDLDLVELFAGRGMLTEAGRNNGLKCAKFEAGDTFHTCMLSLL